MKKHLDWEMERGTDIPKPGAWLKKAIEDEYQTPAGFLTKSEREALIDAAYHATADFNRQYFKRYRITAEEGGIAEMIYQQCLVDHIVPMLSGADAT